jgi:hypothetical protein
MAGHDNACQKALYPHLSAIVHRLVQGATLSLHITPTGGNVATMQAGLANGTSQKPPRPQPRKKQDAEMATSPDNLPRTSKTIF